VPCEDCERANARARVLVDHARELLHAARAARDELDEIACGLEGGNLQAEALERLISDLEHELTRFASPGGRRNTEG
jgi:hypothetical protein